MYIFDGRITMENREILERYLQGFDHQTSGLSFSSMYMWRNTHEYSWEILGDYMCIAAISHLEQETGILRHSLFPPMSADGKYDPAALKDTIFRAKQRFDELNEPFSISLVPFSLVKLLMQAFPGQLEIQDDRPNYDYVYRVQDLCELKGRLYHAKKNHLNYFRKNYTYEYVKLTADMAKEAMQFIAEFNERKSNSQSISAKEMMTLRMEEQAMEDVLLNLEEAGYEGGAIRIDGKLEALAIGGRLNHNTVTEHVEKANIHYRGLYQAINNEFCRQVSRWAEFINREEDMGIPNLRKAKLSYHPYKLVEKYIVTFKGEVDQL